MDGRSSQSVAGLAGALYVGAYRAATIGPWTLTREDDAVTVTFAVQARDPTWAIYPVTGVRLEVGRHEWRWRIVGGSLEEGAVRGSGRAEVRDRG